MFSSSDIRREAREVLGLRFFGGEWLYAVLVGFLVSVINSFGGSIPFAAFILAGPISIASAAYFLNRLRRRGRHDDLGILFDAAKDDLGGNIVLGILNTLFIMLWTFLFIIPGIVKSISYSMVYYIKRDNPNLSATEAITESRRLMDGYKWKYFVLQLSFIGWYIVGFLCLGVGVLWAQALNSAANAVFYERLLAERGISYGNSAGGSANGGSGEKPLWESVVGGGAANRDPWNPTDPWSAPQASDSDPWNQGGNDGVSSGKPINPGE